MKKPVEVADIRTRLIESATTEFLAHGYEQANVGRIATAARISKKTVYKFFESKVELLRAVMHASMIATLDGVGPFVSGQQPQERLAARLNAFAELAFSPKGATSYRLLMSEGARFPEMARLYVAAITTFGVEPLARDLNDYIKAGKLSLDDPVLAARMLMAMVFAEHMRDAGLGVAEPPTVEEAKTLINSAVKLFLQGANIVAPGERPPDF